MEKCNHEWKKCIPREYDFLAGSDYECTKCKARGMEKRTWDKFLQKYSYAVNPIKEEK